MIQLNSQTRLLVFLFMIITTWILNVSNGFDSHTKIKNFRIVNFYLSPKKSDSRTVHKSRAAISSLHFKPSSLHFSCKQNSIHSQTLVLSMAYHDKDDEDDKEKQNQTPPKSTEDDDRELFFFVEEKQVLAVDVLSILIAAQLLGLADVLADTTFWSNGAFRQPIPSIPSTLPTLVSRTCIICFTWIVASLKNKGFAYGAMTSIDEYALPRAFTTIIDFSSSIVLVTLASSILQHSPVDRIEILREIWFTILIIGTFRTIYTRMYF